MAEISDLNTTDDSNTARFPEGQAPSTVNNGARALEGMIARLYADLSGGLASTGSSNAYALALNRGDFDLTSAFDGYLIGFIANHASTGAATLNVTPNGGSAQGAVPLRKFHDVAIASGDIEAGAFLLVQYEFVDGTTTNDRFQIVSALAGSAHELVSDTTPQLGGDLDLNGNAIDFPSTANISDVLDEDDMSSDSATALATQQSIKAYVDTEVGNVSTLTAGTALEKNPLATSSSTVQAHGLASRPFIFDGYIEQTDVNGDAGYSQGDRIDLGYLYNDMATAITAGFVLMSDATNVRLLIGASATRTIRKDNQADTNLTMSKWKAVITPYALS